MPRPPFPAAKAKRLLEAWIALRIPKSPDDAPIDVPSALAYLAEQKIEAHRSALYKYKLHEVIKAGAHQQRHDGGGARRSAEQQAYQAQLDALRAENATLAEHNRQLRGMIATMTYNARALHISDAELTAPLPVPSGKGGSGGKTAPAGPRSRRTE